MITDFGIFLEIGGFLLFMLAPTSPPNKGNVGYDEGKNSKWKYVYLSIGGRHKPQLIRVLAIGLVLIGLIFQLSYFNNYL